jgi:DNA-directed RNA polymerase specialized sigma24 family protein
MANAKLGPEVVVLLLGFQQTGNGFDNLWEAIAPTVELLAVNRLRKHLVWERPGRVDRVAVAEVGQQVSAKLLQLNNPKRNGKFNPAKASPGAAGVARWLFGIVSNEVADYCRTWRKGRGNVKFTSISGLHLNALGGVGVDRSPPPKIGPVDVTAILNRCLDRLDEKLAMPVRLRLAGFTDRAAAERLGCTASTVNKRIAKATVQLRPLLEAEGVDESFLDSLAV